MANGNRNSRLPEVIGEGAVFLLGRDGRIVGLSRSVQQAFGTGRDEIIGRHVSCLYPDEDIQAGVPDHLLALAAKDGEAGIEAWRVRGDGRHVWVQVGIDAIWDEAGDLIGFAHVSRDMTARREAEDDLRASERRFRLLVQGVTDYAIFMLDLAGHVTNWNAGAQQIKGYTIEEILGEHFSRFYTDEDRAAGKPDQMLQAARQLGHVADEGWRIRKNGNRFWASVVIDAVRDEAGELIGFAKITRDITERQQMQQALEQAREQLFQVQKLEAMGNLTGGIAHDFNNLLTVIRGSAELAERDSMGKTRLQQLLAAIQAAAGRAAELTHQMLAFSRRQPLRPELLDLSQVLLEIAEFLDRSLRGDINTVVNVPADLWPVEIDPRQFELAMLNIGLNARDAMPGGGTLRISAFNSAIDDQGLGLTGDFVRIAVADAGEGIPGHLLQKVIEPFFTTKAVGKGSGLGLSQAYGFAQQSGGTLTVESQFGQGTTVTFYLPAKTDSLRCLRSAIPSQRPAADSKGTVLVVEDDLAVATLAAAVLEDSGYRVVLVHRAAEALVRLEQGEGFDLVFSDIIMPGGMNGVELAQIIRTRYPHIPVLLTTGYSDAAISKEARSFPLITKPYTLDALTTRVAELFVA